MLIRCPGAEVVAARVAPAPASWDWTAIGTVALAVLTFATLLYTIIAATSERRQAARDRADPEERLREERAASERRILDDRKHADEVRRRERQIANATELIGRIADLQHYMGVLPAATFGRRRPPDRPKDHLQELGEQELLIAIRSLRRGAWAEGAMLGASDAARRASDRYGRLVQLVYQATGTPFLSSRDTDTLLNYSRWVRISLRTLADNETVPLIQGGSPEYPLLGLAEHMPAWVPHPLPAGWDDEADIDAPVRRSSHPDG
jgi:hypothetical protein